MLTGEPPSAQAARTLDAALILHADHELNASTFAARVVASTLADMHAAVTAALGALDGAAPRRRQRARDAAARGDRVARARRRRRSGAARGRPSA